MSTFKIALSRYGPSLIFGVGALLPSQGVHAQVPPLQPLSSILFAPQYLFSGIDQRKALINPGTTNSQMCTAGLCVVTPGSSNEMWRIGVGLREPIPFEALAAVKLAFVRFGDAYRPIATVRVVPLRPFMDSIRLMTHVSLASALRKNVDSTVGTAAELWVEQLVSRYSYWGSMSVTNIHKFYVKRAGQATKFECDNSVLGNALCKPFEVPITISTLSAVDESFKIGYLLSVRVLEGKFVSDVTVDAVDTTAGILKLQPSFPQTVRYAVEMQMRGAAKKLTAELNSRLDDFKKTALAGLKGDGAALDLNWRLTATAIAPFEPEPAGTKWANYAPNAADQVFPTTADIYPCIESTPAYSAPLQVRLYEADPKMFQPGTAGAPRILSPPLDVNAEPFAIEFEFEGSPLPAVAARAFHTSARKESKDFSLWWERASVVCENLISGRLTAAPVPIPAVANPANCPAKPGNDGEPIPPGCKY